MPFHVLVLRWQTFPVDKGDDAARHVNMTNINHRDYKTSNIASNTWPEL
jgi:hypothetical protein